MFMSSVLTGFTECSTAPFTFEQSLTLPESISVDTHVAFLVLDGKGKFI